MIGAESGGDGERGEGRPTPLEPGRRIPLLDPPAGPRASHLQPLGLRASWGRGCGGALGPCSPPPTGAAGHAHLPAPTRACRIRPNPAALPPGGGPGGPSALLSGAPLTIGPSLGPQPQLSLNLSGGQAPPGPGDRTSTPHPLSSAGDGRGLAPSLTSGVEEQPVSPTSRTQGSWRPALASSLGWLPPPHTHTLTPYSH